jgi:hypothetical protein
VNFCGHLRNFIGFSRNNTKYGKMKNKSNIRSKTYWRVSLFLKLHFDFNANEDY